MSYPWQAITVICNKLQILKYITYNFTYNSIKNIFQLFSENLTKHNYKNVYFVTEKLLKYLMG